MAMEQLKQRIAGEIALSENPGAAMKKWRDIFSISQVQLSGFLKISPSTISDYESNRRQSPGIGVVRRFTDALFTIDESRGGAVTKRFKESETPAQDFFDAYNFEKAISGKKLAELLDAKVLSGGEKLDSLSLFGATVVDAVKVILEMPYESFMKIYSTTSQRALMFTKVDTGRSTLVAVRMAPIKPAVVVLHNLKEENVDKLAVKIAESEGLPLLLVNMPLEDAKKKLQGL